MTARKLTAAEKRSMRLPADRDAWAVSIAGIPAQPGDRSARARRTAADIAADHICKRALRTAVVELMPTAIKLGKKGRPRLLAVLAKIASQVSR
jgi:hypothetical protein